LSQYNKTLGYIPDPAGGVNRVRVKPARKTRRNFFLRRLNMSHKKSTVKVSSMTAALAFMIIGILGSCQNSLDSELSPEVAGARSQSIASVQVNPQAWPMGNVAGTWESSVYGEKFLINNSTLTYGYDMGSGFIQVYKGNIVQATGTSASTGYIYIQYTQPLDNDWIGHYYAVYWSNFASPYTAIRLSGCSDGPGKETLADAITTYTYANGYFSGFSDFDKVGPPPPAVSRTFPTVTGNSSGAKPPFVLLLEQQASITTKTE
jgi:hypothetical protein